MSFEHVFQICLLAASLGLGLFCLILARRLRKLNDLETGLGAAIAVMSAEVERLEQAIRQAQVAASGASQDLSRQIRRARDERGLWDLHQQLNEAGQGPQPGPPPRRLRKREGLVDA